MNDAARSHLSLIVLTVGLLSTSGFAQSSKPSTSKPAAPSSSTRTNTSPAPSNCGLFAGDGSGRSSGSGPCPTVNTTSQSTVALPSSQAGGGSQALGAIQGLLNGMATSMTNLANTGNTPVGDTGGLCYWSSEWNGLNPELQGRLRQRQTVDTLITQYGGPAQLITYAQSSGNLEREFSSLQGQGLGTDTDFKLMADGFVDVAKCRLGEHSTPAFERPILIDAATFKQSGTDAIDKSMDDLLKEHDVADCDSALQYVGAPNGLQKDLDVAIAQRRVHENGLDSQQKLKADLLSDSWWATSKGPVVAAQIKVVCDEVQDFVSVFNPEAAKLSQGKDFLLKGLKVAESMIKGAYENRESVTAAIKAAKEEEAKELADIAKEELADAVRMGPAYGTYKALEDSKEYVKTLNDAADAREVVQDQLRKLDQQIAQARNQVSIDAQKQTALEALRADVVNVCVQKPIDIPPR